MGLAEEAQDLGLRGFRVHPLKAKDQPYTAYSRTATSDPDAIARLFAPFPDALIGICTGRGLVVVDDDRGLVGPDESLPLTLTATTPSRGYHHYYSCATLVRNSASKIAEGIDIRGEGGYVVAPPSEGREWLFPEHVELAPLPSVLLAACLRSAPAASAFEPRSHVSAGERHDYLVRFAGWALANELAETGGDLVVLVLDHAFAVCDPWPRDEIPGVERHVREICRWVIARESGRG
jgi:hypothetical protein